MKRVWLVAGILFRSEMDFTMTAVTTGSVCSISRFHFSTRWGGHITRIRLKPACFAAIIEMKVLPVPISPTRMVPLFSLKEKATPEMVCFCARMGGRRAFGRHLVWVRNIGGRVHLLDLGDNVLLVFLNELVYVHVPTSCKCPVLRLSVLIVSIGSSLVVVTVSSPSVSSITTSLFEDSPFIRILSAAFSKDDVVQHSGCGKGSDVAYPERHQRQSWLVFLRLE